MGSSWNSSYILGVDKENGWGERYFFTYYSQLEPRSLSWITLELTICCAILILSLASNMFIAFCILRYPDMRTVTNCLVLNLAAADLLLALTIPEVAYTRIVAQWRLGATMCKLVPYTQFVSGVVLLWTLALISMDRHRCVVIPPYRSNVTPKQASLLSLLIWIISSVIALPIVIWFREQSSVDGNVVCTLVFPKSDTINYSLCFVVPVVLLACLLPMTLLVYNYQMVFHKIMSTKDTWASSCVVMSSDTKTYPGEQKRRQSEVSLSEIFVPWPRRLSAAGQLNTRHGSLSYHEEIRVNKHIKVVRILFLNVVLVLLMWLPITVVVILILVDGLRPNEDRNFFLRSHHFVAALIVAFLNTVVTPLLYGLLSDSFRVYLKKVLCKSEEGEMTRIIKDALTPSSAKSNGGLKKVSLANSASDTL